MEADWPLFGGGGFTSRGVEAPWAKRLYPKLAAPGPVALERLAAIHRALAAALPPA